MTNVKLKLMFNLLNVLLTAHIVQARPHSDTNSTDLGLNFAYNDTFHIPVDPNADTLIVTNEYEDHLESEESEHSQMEAIMNAEQGRDTEMSSKYNKKEQRIKNKAEVESKFPESGNNTNLHLDAIIDAEMDRDVAMLKKTAETDKRVLEIPPSKLDSKTTHVEELIRSEMNKEDVITDIRSDIRSEFAEIPKFEFLIATKINDSDANKTDIKSAANDNSLLRNDRNSSDVLKKVDYVELVEVLKASKVGDNKSDYNLANITVHEVEDDLEPDTILSVFSGFNDVQTWFLACFATLVPLLGVLCATLFIRSMCRRWCRKKSEDSLSESSEKYDDNQPIKSSPEESPGTEDPEQGEGTPANGSIFTMTLKNNHLIVETEERNDFTKNGRETKMKYSPDNDGIFVVEVQQSTGYRPINKAQHTSPPQDPQISTNQALIHHVPDEQEKREDSEKRSTNFQKDRALALSSTGLSISDLSMSSIGSHNVSYSYGSQLGYEHGPFGYPLYAGYDIKDDGSDGIVHDNSQEPLISKTPTDPDKPVVTAAIFKQDSIIGNDVLQGPGYSIEGSTDGPLLSDVQAREISLQVLHDQKEKRLENGAVVKIADKVENDKKPLCRADSLPAAFEELQPVESKPVMETIRENDVNDTGPTKDALKGKRASLPMISTEVYESVKDVIRPPGSPKFEKLRNDSSPGDNNFDQPPMITITEEIEGKAENAS